MRTLVLLLAVLALAVAGCGGDDGNTDTGTGAAQAAPTPTATATAAAGSGGGKSAGTLEIKMKDIRFDPVEAQAKVGQKVVWVNEDDAPHNVVGGPIKSPTYGKGEKFSYTPEKAGTIDYVCTIHPGMEGRLTVTGG